MAEFTADVCVVGAGPAGITIALEVARSGRTVVVIESGQRQPSEAAQALGDTPHFDPARHAPMNLATRRQIGGASNIWGGRCVPYDPIDFEQRPGIPFSKWPITYEEIAQYYQRASDWFFTGKAIFSAHEITELPHATLIPGLPDGDVLSSTLERWSLPTNFGREYAAELASTPSLRVETGLTCVEIVTTPNGAEVAHLVCRGMDRSDVQIHALQYVLACGALETTRLLLASDRQHAGGLGNNSGYLGRFYMGHISGRIARVVFDTPPNATAYSYDRDTSGVYVRHRLSFSRDCLRREQMPNIVSWLVNPEIADPAHASGILSFAYLALSSPLFGKWFIADAIRKAAIGDGPRIIWPHIRNMLCDLTATFIFIPTFAYRRFLCHRKVPGFFVPSNANTYPLHYHGEQVPDPASHVRLVDERDSLGLRKLHIDLRFTDKDVDGVLRAHELWDEYLRRHRCGRLEYFPGDLRQSVWDQAADGYHQVGTTRMSAGPEDGVVNEHLQVHGIHNLYVASSSVFVTSGQANSTFMIVAFALRLADRLRHQLSAGHRRHPIA